MRPEVGAPSSTPKKCRPAIGISLLATLSLVGCRLGGAPWFSLFGAYFPGWMLCGLIGVFGAVLARAIFLAIGLDPIVRLPLLTYGSLGVIFALAAWQCEFGP